MNGADDPIVQAERCRQLWCAVILDAVQPARNGADLAMSFLYDKSGAWKDSRVRILDAAGIDPVAFDEALRERPPMLGRNKHAKPLTRPEG